MHGTIISPRGPMASKASKDKARQSKRRPPGRGFSPQNPPFPPKTPFRMGDFFLLGGENPSFGGLGPLPPPPLAAGLPGGSAGAPPRPAVCGAGLCRSFPPKSPPNPGRRRGSSRLISFAAAPRLAESGPLGGWVAGLAGHRPRVRGWGGVASGRAPPVASLRCSPRVSARIKNYRPNGLASPRLVPNCLCLFSRGSAPLPSLRLLAFPARRLARLPRVARRWFARHPCLAPAARLCSRLGRFGAGLRPARSPFPLFFRWASPFFVLFCGDFCNLQRS